MYSFHIIDEFITNGLNYNFLNLIAIVCMFCGIFVIVVNNPIVSVLFLIGLFISISCYLMMLGINFIGLSYLLVYVGAVSILFLFILMLINVRISELVTGNTNSVPLAIMIVMFFNMDKVYSAFIDMPGMNPFQMNLNNDIQGNAINDTFKDVYLASSQSWDGRLAEALHITSIGNVLYTNYPLWLILTSIILLLAMIGSILITIKQ